MDGTDQELSDLADQMNDGTIARKEDVRKNPLPPPQEVPLLPDSQREIRERLSEWLSQPWQKN